MRSKSIRYFIIDANNKVKSVSKEEHEIWVAENAHKYNRSKTFDDGAKKASLTFIGKKEPDEEKIIFQVHTEWWSGGEIVETPFATQNFNSYKQAVKNYEWYLIIDGGYDDEPSPEEEGKNIEIVGWIGASKNEKAIILNTAEIETISEGEDITTIWTTRKTKSVIHTKLSFKKVMKLIK